MCGWPGCEYPESALTYYNISEPRDFSVHTTDNAIDHALRRSLYAVNGRYLSMKESEHKAKCLVKATRRPEQRQPSRLL
jgi:hypothetical protein